MLFPGAVILIFVLKCSNELLYQIIVPVPGSSGFGSVNVNEQFKLSVFIGEVGLIAVFGFEGGRVMLNSCIAVLLTFPAESVAFAFQ